MSGILVILEQSGGGWHRMSFETLAAAQQVAAGLGVPVSAAVLGDAIDSAHDLAIERCMNLGSPGVAVARPDADDKPAEQPAGVVVEFAARVDHEQVIGEALAKHVRAVARDAVAGSVDGHPLFAAEWEVDDDGPNQLIRHVLMLRVHSKMRGAERAQSPDHP